MTNHNSPLWQLLCHDSFSEQNQQEVNLALRRLADTAKMPQLVIASIAMLKIIEVLAANHASRATILITGETGTGKELIARAAHALSSCSQHEFNAFNCTTVGREIIENQLFGHQRGSYTGANNDSQGIIRATEGGTLFLDEIGELPLEAQPKLLRFLQEGEVHPVGAPRAVKVNVRIIAATNRNLEAEVEAGNFRADLFERLNVMNLHVPPLRERREEVPLFVKHFLAQNQAVEFKSGIRLGDEVSKLLYRYDWPCNVRELANEIHRLVLYAKNNEVVSLEKLSLTIRDRANSPPTKRPATGEGAIVIDGDLPYSQARDELQRAIILRKLNLHGGNVSRAATALQMDRSGLLKAMARLGIRLS